MSRLWHYGIQGLVQRQFDPKAIFLAAIAQGNSQTCNFHFSQPLVPRIMVESTSHIVDEQAVCIHRLFSQMLNGDSLLEIVGLADFENAVVEAGDEYVSTRHIGNVEF